MEIRRDSAIMVNNQGSIYSIELDYILNKILHTSSTGSREEVALFYLDNHYEYENGKVIKDELLKRGFIVKESIKDEYYALDIEW